MHMNRNVFKRIWGPMYRARTNYTRRMTTMQNPYAGDEHTPLPDQTPQSQQSPQFPPSRSYSYLNEQYGQFGQPPSQSMPPTYQSYQPSHQPAPGQFQPPPATPTARPSRGLRTG